MLLLWSAFCVCAVLSLASVPWVLARQRRRVDDLASFSSLVAAGPGMLLFASAHLPVWAWADTASMWPLFMLGVLWAGLWVFGGPWLLRECARHRTREHATPLLDGVRLAHAGCWLTSTLLPLLATLGWLLEG